MALMPSRREAHHPGGAYSVPGQLQVRANPSLVARLVDGAEILSDGGERRRASEILTEVVRVVPNDARAWLVLGDDMEPAPEAPGPDGPQYIELAGIGDAEIPARSRALGTASP